MQIQFAFKHMDASDALRDYAEKKVREKIEKFVTKPIVAQVTFAVDKLDHKAHLGLSGGDGFNLQVEHVCSDMYGSIDHMVDKLEAQLKRQKEKLKSHKHKSKGIRDLAEEAAEAVSDQILDEESIDANDVIRAENRRKVKV